MSLFPQYHLCILQPLQDYEHQKWMQISFRLFQDCFGKKMDYFSNQINVNWKGRVHVLKSSSLAWVMESWRDLLQQDTVAPPLTELPLGQIECPDRCRRLLPFTQTIDSVSTFDTDSGTPSFSNFLSSGPDLTHFLQAFILIQTYKIRQMQSHPIFPLAYGTGPAAQQCQFRDPFLTHFL